MSRPTKETPKTGPNEPCWCGSGAKLKRCHAAPKATGPRKPLTPSRATARTMAVLALYGPLAAIQR